MSSLMHCIASWHKGGGSTDGQGRVGESDRKGRRLASKARSGSGHNEQCWSASAKMVMVAVGGHRGLAGK